MVIECAFGRLKARFGALSQEMALLLLSYPMLFMHVLSFITLVSSKMRKLERMNMAREVAYDREFQPEMLGNRCSLGNCNEANGKRVRNIFMFFD